VQNSLRESVRQLLMDKISKFGLTDEFEVLDAEIRGRSGSLIIFKGMQHYNADTIKSLEGFDGAWVEEAQSFSATSLRYLRPTIRKDGSEIWFSWNPRNKRDAVDHFMRQEKPAEAICVRVGWQDNPWFPAVLKKEKDHDYEADPINAAHVWGGEYQMITQGSYYGRLIAKARLDKRVTKVPYDPKLQVCTAWDLGMQGCIWFFQHVGLERRVIGFYQKEGAGLDHFGAYVKNLDYAYEAHYLPHDIEAREISSGQVRLDILRSMKIGPIRVVPAESVENGIETVRSILPQCWFDESCEEGLEALSQYEAEYVEDHGVFKPKPLHNWASHPCFVGETEILTHNGMCQIRNLPEVGEVLTSCGWKAYRNPRITRKDAPLVEVRFIGGYTVNCTPDHLFKTASGWRSARSLTRNTEIQSSLMSLPNISTEDCTGSTRLKSTFRAAARSCTARFGAWLSGPFQLDATSITRMPILPITGWTISNASLLPSTSPILGGRTSKLTAPEDSTTVPGRKRLTGTNPMPVGFGIRDMPNGSRAGPNGGESRRIAQSAAQSFSASIESVLTPRNTAQPPARPLLIESVRPLSERADVWCLTVPGAEEFSLANGALVHNCDAFRMYAMGHRPQAKVKAPKDFALPPGIV